MLNTKELIEKHTKYWQKMMSLLEDAQKGTFPKKQQTRKQSYLNFLRHEIDIVTKKLETLKLGLGDK